MHHESYKGLTNADGGLAKTAQDSAVQLSWLPHLVPFSDRTKNYS